MDELAELQALENGKIEPIQYQCPRAVGSSRGRGTTTLEVEMHDQSTLRRGSVASICRHCNKVVRIFPSRVRYGGGSYCSLQCRIQAKSFNAEKQFSNCQENWAGFVLILPCRRWTGTKSSGGYGRVRLNGAMEQSHRVMYEYFIGAIPAGLELDHLCRQRDCVEPTHLDPVTRTENLKRAGSNIGRSGRIVAQQHRREQTHCYKGHPLCGDNLYVGPHGNRHCRICRAATSLAYYHRHKQ